jgi:formylglycine-generating enzyme required for sulfatase activity
MLSRRLLFASLVALGTSLASVGAPLPRRGPQDGPLAMKFVRLPRGTFYMGGGGGAAGNLTRIKEDFEIAVYTVTQEQWQALMGNNPSSFQRGTANADRIKDVSDEDLKQFPVEAVSWNDAQEFIRKLNERERGKGWTYRLPTDAEWEYACRGGPGTEEEGSYHFYFDRPTNDLSSEQANFHGEFPDGDAPKGKALNRPTKVGSYRPNRIGLYDMHGNIWQWCEDRWDLDETHRVTRGGTWGGIASYCRAGYRTGLNPTWRTGFHGFRLVRVPSDGK